LLPSSFCVGGVVVDRLEGFSFRVIPSFVLTSPAFISFSFTKSLEQYSLHDLRQQGNRGDLFVQQQHRILSRFFPSFYVISLAFLLGSKTVDWTMGFILHFHVLVCFFHFAFPSFLPPPFCHPPSSNRFQSPIFLLISPFLIYLRFAQKTV